MYSVKVLILHASKSVLTNLKLQRTFALSWGGQEQADILG